MLIYQSSELQIIINAICWAGPFATIALIPGIGAGNISTYLLLKRYRKINHNNNDKGSDHDRGQFIVGLISLTAIPIVFEVHINTIIVDIICLCSRRNSFYDDKEKIMFTSI